MSGTVERMVGRYELVGFNGSVLPAEVGDDSEPDAGLRAFLLEGALCLSADWTYDLSLTARYDTPAGTRHLAVSRLSAGRVVGRDHAGLGERANQQRRGDPAVVDPPDAGSLGVEGPRHVHLGLSPPESLARRAFDTRT